MVKGGEKRKGGELLNVVAAILYGCLNGLGKAGGVKIILMMVPPAFFIGAGVGLGLIRSVCI